MNDGSFKVFAFQIDAGRQLERPEVIRRALSGMGRLGYNACQIYLEDAYKFPRHPAIGRPRAYTMEFMREVQGIAAGEGIEVIPVIPALAHCAYITTKPGYGHYDEGRGTVNNYGTLSPSFPDTYTLLRELFEDWCLHIPGKYVQVGLDEASAMGSYHVRTHGAASFDPVEMFARHANKINAILKSLGRRMIMGGDMFYYLPEAMDPVDKDIIVLDWFYYRFGTVTRVEAFNFSDIDLSGVLIKKGFEVWGTAAVWPNSPFPDVADRWEALNDWIRYGRRVGLTGLINCDWENRAGFYSNADLLFRAFGSNLLRERPELIDRQLAETMTQIARVDCSGLVGDVMKLGRYHVTGHENRRLINRPLASRANRNRQQECQEKYQALSQMFRMLPEVMARSSTVAGRQMLTGLRLSWRLLVTVWKLGAVLPDVYNSICSDGQAAALVKTLSELADEVEAFGQEYCRHWDTVRFTDDPSWIGAWAEKVVRDLRAWAQATQNQSLAEHPLAVTPRLECTLHCRRPALPVAMLSAVWADGTRQTVNETMIPFESAYACPEVHWRQFPSIVLERQELPARIEVRSVNYGQVGVEALYVIWKGRKAAYRLEKTEGSNVQREGEIIWLGPICQKVGDPLGRKEWDGAWFEKR